MNNELERIGKKEVMASFEVLCWQLFCGTGENKKIFQSGHRFSGLKCETRTYQNTRQGCSPLGNNIWSNSCELEEVLRLEGE
jgi:hypothetical protein